MPTASKTNLPCIVLTGPTAVGKTDSLAVIDAAVRKYCGMSVEVICADAFQAYRGLDIGTAKPTEDIRQQYSYHLIDILDPDAQYTAGQFLERADSACEAVRSRGKIPVLEGGSVFYLQTFLTGMPAAPAASPDIRYGVQHDRDEYGDDYIRSELGRLDPAAAARIPAGDLYRQQRALEICRQTGRPASEYRYTPCLRSHLQLLLIGLQRERQELYGRIEQRVETMFVDGLLGEVGRLIARGYGPQDPGLKAIGYREFWDDTGAPRKNSEHIKRLIQRDSRRLAKRQITFMRRLPGIELLPAARSCEAVDQAVKTFCSAADLCSPEALTYTRQTDKNGDS